MEIINFVHLQRPHEADLDTESSVMASTIDANKNAIINGNPLRVNLMALNTKVVHINFHL
jgi:hypothetical protein